MAQVGAHRRHGATRDRGACREECAVSAYRVGEACVKGCFVWRRWWRVEYSATVRHFSAVGVERATTLRHNLTRNPEERGASCLRPP